MTDRDPTCLVDFSHVAGRRITGIERISLELFSDGMLPGLGLRPVRATGRWSMLATQTMVLPAMMALARRRWLICPGFPPSLPLMTVAGDRVIACIHDLFPLTRSETLTSTGRWYIRPALRHTLRRGRHFIVFSESVEREVRRICRSDAEIALYRPVVRDVFNLSGDGSVDRVPDGTVRLLSVGTIEPRKNYQAAAAIVGALGEMGLRAELHIVGRPGWGPDADRLATMPGVVLHGYLDEAAMRALVWRCHAFIYPTSAEGLGLPVLELQFAGLPVIANDLPVLRETLGDSALFVPIDDHRAGAERIAALVADHGALARMAVASRTNVARWNARALDDRRTVAATITRWIGAA